MSLWDLYTCDDGAGKWLSHGELLSIASRTAGILFVLGTCGDSTTFLHRSCYGRTVISRWILILRDSDTRLQRCIRVSECYQDAIDSSFLLRGSLQMCEGRIF